LSREAGLEESKKSVTVTAVTVTLAVPLTPPLAAVTVKGPPAVVAENRPAAPMVPTPPPTDQLNVGCGLSALPNWSRPVAVNCCVPPVWTEALAGETVIVVRTGVAVVEATTAKLRVCHCAKKPQMNRQPPVTWLLPQTTPGFAGSGDAPA